MIKASTFINTGNAEKCLIDFYIVLQLFPRLKRQKAGKIWLFAQTWTLNSNSYFEARAQP